jgi:hypothetical protein
VLRRGLGIGLASLLVITGVGLVVVVAPDHDHGKGHSQATLSRKHPRFHCDGISHKQVRGDRPTYTHKTLADFRNHQRLCAGWWLPRPRKLYVPQGLAVAGRTAWVSGFRYAPGYGERACRLLRIDLRNGRALERRALVGRVGKRPSTYCRHGGGMAQTRGGWLWVVQSGKLWLFRGKAAGNTIHAARVWRLEAPVRGSSVVFTRHLVGLVPFQLSGVPHIYWFKVRTMLRPHVLDLGARRRRGVDLVAAARTRIPTYVQGAAMGPHGSLYLSRSNLACGELVTPKGRIAFVPGAEGIQFNRSGDRLFAVSESGAVPYSHSRKPLTPAISSFEWPGLLHGKKSHCRFR